MVLMSENKVYKLYFLLVHISHSSYKTFSVNATLSPWRRIERDAEMDGETALFFIYEIGGHVLLKTWPTVPIQIVTFLNLMSLIFCKLMREFVLTGVQIVERVLYPLIDFDL